MAGQVSKLTNDQQLPYKTGIVTEEFYFKPKANDSPGQVVIAEKPEEPAKPFTTQTYYYYTDQNGNRSTNSFADWEAAESEMRSRKLYCKIYNNAGEVFVVDKPAEPVKTVTAVKRNGEVWNPDGIEMVFVQGGKFTMGCTPEQGNDCFDNERPSHQVTVGDFYIGKYEVTQAQWKAVMGTTVQQQRDKAGASLSLRGEGDNYPMYYVSWNEVQEFIRRLNVNTGKQYRLPTEAEWEYAAKGGTVSNGYKFSGGNTANSVAWYYENAGDMILDEKILNADHSNSNNNKTHPVGTKSSNELGIYDMSGNVWEWCSDWFGNYSSRSQNDPLGPSKGAFRVYRGGSWYSDAVHVRTSYRNNGTPGSRFNFLGFRLACSSK